MFAHVISIATSLIY